MRRGIEIRTAFAPTRTSAAHLHAAYELVSRGVERTVAAAQRVVADERDAGATLVQRQRKTGANR
jgi:hypothetical protein